MVQSTLLQLVAKTPRKHFFHFLFICTRCQLQLYSHTHKWDHSLTLFSLLLPGPPFCYHRQLDSSCQTLDHALTVLPTALQSTTFVLFPSARGYLPVQAEARLKHYSLGPWGDSSTISSTAADETKISFQPFSLFWCQLPGAAGVNTHTTTKLAI